ncbi:MAG: hypothetical protein H8D45_28385 [Bacteroidetes bacterium]|nr:hypothetical protein [Bacteroidota bacterium]MBL7104825.1 hypothetical protein [Bacteroidales bacterium]
MRNEIFEKISQSRKRFYEEHLKSSSTLTESNLEICKERETGKGLSDFLSKNKKINFPDMKFDLVKIRGINNEKLTRLSTSIRKCFALFQHNMQKVNQNINNRTERMTQGFYNLSSGIFEDRYDDVAITDTKRGVVVMQTVQAREMVWEFAYPVKLNISGDATINEKINLTVFNIKGLVRKAFREFRLFWEYDGAIDSEPEPNRIKAPEIKEKRLEINPNEKTQQINIIDFCKALPQIFKNKTFRTKLYNAIFLNPVSQIFGFVFNVDLICMICKKIYNLLFPVINRFI